MTYKSLRPSVVDVINDLLHDTTNIGTPTNISKERLAISSALSAESHTVISYIVSGRKQNKDAFIRRLARLDKNVQILLEHIKASVRAKRCFLHWQSRTLRPSDNSINDPGGVAFNRVRSDFYSLSV